VHGSQARASFNASVDLGRGGLSWHYQGSFRLRRTSSGWRVVWAPSVIVPGLGAGDRLAVLTTMPRRAVLLDAEGHSLITPSPAIELGVVPGELRDPLRTAQRLAKVTGLAPSDAVEMAGQIEAWPSKRFLELVTLAPADYRKLRRKLHQVPGLKHHLKIEPLFISTVPLITGQVATETAKTLVDDGEPYRPGTTIGLTGLQQAFQARLAGRPTTEIVVQNGAGKRVKVLYSWHGSASSDVRTTINGAVQAAARNALSGVGLSAAIVAVRAGGGQILAVARHTERGMPTLSPLDGRYQPGQSFTIVSTAALLAKGSVTANALVDCNQKYPFGGQTFVNTPAGPNTSAETFREVFAHACSTAFAGLSLDLSASELIGAAQRLGIRGTPWKLQLPAFPGQISNPGSNADELASETIGSGSVLVSPLNMALAAGAVDSGSWRAPSLVTPSPTQLPTRLRLSRTVDAQLRGLMRATVRSGVATAANVPGAPVYGQVGTALLHGHHGLRVIWFVGFRGGVAFAVVVFARSAAFSPAVRIAGQFAAGLPSGS
jgi:cell division protein FtsI/penicillin-binding protein 2